MGEVEDALIEYLQQHVLSDAVMQLVLAEIRTEIAAQLPKQEADIAGLETEVATARGEQKRLAKAVAMADDVPELVSELRKRSARIAHLEAQILSAKRTPDDLVALVTRIETSARARLQDLKTALADRRDLREVFLSLFPDGLTFTPARSPDGERQLWRIAGTANLSSLLGPVGPDCIATPTGQDAIGRTGGSFRAVGGAAAEEPPTRSARQTRVDSAGTLSALICRIYKEKSWTRTLAPRAPR